jgi:prepilin-type processing-associated H-X9-DG protein
LDTYELTQFNLSTTPPSVLRVEWRGAMHAIAGGPKYYDSSVWTIQAQDLNPGGGLPGISILGSEETLTGIIDRTSNTLLVGESTNIDQPSRRTFWSYTYTTYNQSSITSESRIINNNYNRCATTAGNGADNPCKRGFGSNHDQGLNFALCDGSVRFVSNSVDINLLAAAATIAGGEVANLP